MGGTQFSPQQSPFSKIEARWTLPAFFAPGMQAHVMGWAVRYLQLGKSRKRQERGRIHSIGGCCHLAGSYGLSEAVPEGVQFTLSAR